MGTRLELQSLLEKTIGSQNVYYQPPASYRMRYPAVRYERTDIRVNRADNLHYTQTTGYLVTIIDQNPDSELVEKISKLPMCRFERHYAANNLNHDVFLLFF